MKNINKYRLYIINVLISSTAVSLFAFLQYNFIQKAEFNPNDYVIPIIVGAIFGTLITRINIILKKLAKEREVVIEKNKKIHSYVGMIVHDLKSPLTAIYSLIDLIDENPDRLNNEQKVYLNLMKQSSSSMLENISLILDNSMLESGIKPDHLEVGNPYYSIQSTIDKYIIEALYKNISIQRNIDKNMPLVEYDKSILDRILSNLISNAIKFSPSNTEVKIYTEVIDRQLNIVVNDEGLGMSEEEMKNVFQEFKRLSARPTGGEVSTGLGLFISKKLIDQLGGKIVAHSDGQNKGSTFRILLNIKSEL